LELATDPIQTGSALPAPTIYSYYANTDTGAGMLPGELATITQPSGRTVTATYRPDGRLAGQTFRDSPVLEAPVVENVVYAYDGWGRRTRMANDAIGSLKETLSTYDNAGRLVTQQTPNLNDNTTSTAQWTYDLVGNQREVQNPNGSRFRYDHDDAGRMTETSVYIDSVCCVPMSSISYDELGRMTAEDLYGGEGSQYRHWTYLPNGAPQPVEYVNLIGDEPNDVSILTSMAYRSDGRLESETTAAQTWTYSYDLAGQLTGRTGGPVDYSYEYNTRGMRLEQTVDGVTTAYTYDDNAQMTTATPSTGPATTYAWDLDGRRTLVDTGTGAARVKVETVYDSRGLPRTAKTYQGAATAPASTETRTYNADRLLVRNQESGTYLVADSIWDPTKSVPQT